MEPGEEEERSAHVDALVLQLASAFSTQDDDAISHCIKDIKALPLEDALQFIHHDDIYQILSAHWRWDHAGEVTDPVSAWLSSWYQVDSQVYKNFVLQFLPDILWTWMVKDKASARRLSGIETLLLCIHNFSTYDSFGKARKFSVPSPHTSSIHCVSPLKEDIFATVSEGSHVETSLPNLLVSDINKKISFYGSVPQIDLISEALYQYANNFANFPRSAQISFLLFAQCLTTWGVSRLKMKKPVHCINGFLAKGVAKVPVTNMNHRFLSEVSQEISAPCSLKLYKERRITFRDVYNVHIIKVLAFCIFDPFPSVSLDTLRLIQSRAQTELSTKSLLLANALLHKFDSRYSPY